MPAIDPVLSLMARLVITAIFASAAVHKLRDVRSFAAAVEDYGLLPRPIITPSAILFAAIELAVAAGLWLHALRTPAALAGAGLLTLYAGAIVINLMRGRRDIDCGCSWGSTPQPLSGWLVIRNVILVLMTLGTALPVATRSFGAADGIVAVLAALALLTLAAAAQALQANAPRLARLREAS